MVLSSLIEELCIKKENNKAGSALTFGGQCISIIHVIFSWDVFIVEYHKM